MGTISRKDILRRYLSWWEGHSQQVGEVHGRVLELRQDGLRQLAGLIEQQVNEVQAKPAALFTLADLQEFATGDIVKCLGQAYAIYAGRRSPRIPNGALLLMSRITQIDGQRGQFDRPSSIRVEYDVPANAWFFDREPDGELPYSICMEIALQPCGFLTAYLGTPLRYPTTDFFFRNLDGQARLTRPIDGRGMTIHTTATLLETVFGGDTIIQRFAFELACDGEVFYEGCSTFGYFTTQSMASQAGLDSGKPVQPWYLKASGSNGRRLSPVGMGGLPQGRLRLIEQVLVEPAGGANQAGYIYASRQNSPDDWYYACHFYQDPVMPGSLGIEAMLQAMKVFARQQSEAGVEIRLAVGPQMKWKYRGQVLQSHRQMLLEVHLHPAQLTGGRRLLSGDASLWADDMRIYETQNMVIEINEISAKNT
jgi:3-hydroxymyristoyl/3-hydroxydecanoyl-(acyl carrier protein) dehydratase